MSGRAVRGHHDGLGLYLRDVLGRDHASLGERVQHGGVVDQVAEDRERPGVGVFEGERNGVTDAKAHAEVGGTKDSHTLQRKVCGHAGLMSSQPNDPTR